RPREHVERALAVVVVVGAPARAGGDPEDRHVDVRGAGRGLRDLRAADYPARHVAGDLGRLDQLHVVIPENCPPVMLSTCPWTKFDHGEQRKNTPPAASAGVPGRPIGISIGATERICSGMPSCTVWPSISIVF